LSLLTGSIPSGLSILTSLQYLDLRRNSGLSGMIPGELCYLQNASCTFVELLGPLYSCELDFDCTVFVDATSPVPNKSLVPETIRPCKSCTRPLGNNAFLTNNTVASNSNMARVREPKIDQTQTR
jgi:hypothetical protein